MIDKTFNFLGSEETVTENGCRLINSCTALNGGQDNIKTSGCDSNEKSVQVKYDKASYLGMLVGSNKSLNLNPQYVWGGDAISLSGNDGVWIDHCKISRTGCHMFVSHYEGSRVTISNTEFEGRTDFSHSCNNDHYWTSIIGSKADKITLDRNYLHDVVPTVNNHFNYNTGHNFDILESGRVLLERNRFENSKTPITADSSKGKIFDVPDDASRASCSSPLGRKCEMNALTASGSWLSRKDTVVLTELGKYKSNLVTPIRYGDVKGTVSGNYGIGRIN
ncbi:hypothetical protein ACJZ2D_011083 [Fusarium nematophilum]